MPVLLPSAIDGHKTGFDPAQPLAALPAFYRRIDGAWRQVHHRGSFDDPGLLVAYRETVR
ncbi:MAG TPA: hypothetical protein VNZ27_06710 [Rhodanobacter sp.]|jgi:hypothetical protein|nr:hypothetical protein [Rhodanobacter sp.]